MKVGVVILLNDKIDLTIELKEFIRDTRKEYGLVFLDLEKKSKYNHKIAWFSQVEGERIKTIRRTDIIDIFRIILDTSEKEAEEYIEKFLTKIDSENDITLLIKNNTYHDSIQELLETLKKCINAIYITSDEYQQEHLVKALNILIKNLSSDSYLTSAFLSLPLHLVSSLSDNNDNSKFIDDLQNLFNEHLQTLIKKSMLPSNDYPTAPTTNSIQI